MRERQIRQRQRQLKERDMKGKQLFQQKGFQKRSPGRQAIVSELDDHTNRIKQLLKADMAVLEQQNLILKAKCKKVNELEDKVENILKQNSQLLTENERLAKILHQKNSEFNILKDKLDSHSAQKMTIAQEAEFERKKLLKQIDNLQVQLRDIQRVKNNQLNDLKSQFQIEIQAIKKKSASTQQVYQQEMRKLRDQNQKKQYDVSDLSSKIKRLNSEAQYQIMRLKEQKEKLKNELNFIEQDRMKEIQVLRKKLEASYSEQIETIKRSHLNSIESFQLENIKLKEMLDQKTFDKQQTNSIISKQKKSYQESISILRKQNDAVRTKLIEYQRLFENEKYSMKSKLSEMHEAELTDLKIGHQKYVDCLQSEIAKFGRILSQKNEQIEQLINQKASVRYTFDSEGHRYKDEIESLQIRLKEAQMNVDDRVTKFELKLKKRNEDIQHLENLNASEAANFESERASLKEIIQKQKKGLESQKLTWREKQNSYKDSISEYKGQNEQLKQTNLRQKAAYMRQIDDLTSDCEIQISNLKSKIESLSSKISVLERENKALNDTVAMKQRQIVNLNERYKAIQNRERKLEKENDDMRTKLIKKDQKMNQMLAEQKDRLENSFTFTLENLKSDHEAAMKLQANRYADIKEKLHRKDVETDELLRAYKKMREQMEGLTEQESNKKSMTLKFPGATSDLIATKNLFDVFLKTKVIDVCSDAVEHKENQYKK